MVTYLTRCKTVKPQRPDMLTCFIYDTGIYTFRKYMSAKKIPGMVQGYHILGYSLWPLNFSAFSRTDWATPFPFFLYRGGKPWVSFFWLLMYQKKSLGFALTSPAKLLYSHTNRAVFLHQPWFLFLVSQILIEVCCCLSFLPLHEL